MAVCVLDASAILAFLNDEPGAEHVERILVEEAEQDGVLTHAVNLVEVLYIAQRALGARRAEELEREIRELGVSVREDLDAEFRRLTAELRTIVLASKTHGRGSLADAFCAALGARERCRVVTSDRKDFEALTDAGRCTLDVIR